jgi:hypothetical protein
MTDNVNIAINVDLAILREIDRKQTALHFV